MGLQVLKTEASVFAEIQSGRRTAIIVKNDRIWSTYDELVFAECDKSENFTGRFVRLGVGGSRFGVDFGLQPAHQLLYLQALNKKRQPVEIETATRVDLETALKQTEANLRAPDVIKQRIID